MLGPEKSTQHQVYDSSPLLPPVWFTALFRTLKLGTYHGQEPSKGNSTFEKLFNRRKVREKVALFLGGHMEVVGRFRWGGR